MNEAFALLQILVPAVAIIVLGLGVGGLNERRHLRHLQAREQTLRHIQVNNLKHVTDPGAVVKANVVYGDVVIASDYFKSFTTKLRNLIGGEMKAALSLMSRARREALVRLLLEAKASGATEVWNVRFGTSSISQLQGKRGAIQVEVFAWGTAVTRRPMHSDG